MVGETRRCLSINKGRLQTRSATQQRTGAAVRVNLEREDFTSSSSRGGLKAGISVVQKGDISAGGRLGESKKEMV